LHEFHHHFGNDRDAGPDHRERGGRAMNYTYYGREALMRAAEEMGVLSDLLKMEFKNPPLLEKVLSDKPKIYLDRFQH